MTLSNTIHNARIVSEAETEFAHLLGRAKRDRGGDQRSGGHFLDDSSAILCLDGVDPRGEPGEHAAHRSQREDQQVVCVNGVTDDRATEFSGFSAAPGHLVIGWQAVPVSLDAGNEWLARDAGCDQPAQPCETVAIPILIDRDNGAAGACRQLLNALDLGK